MTFFFSLCPSDHLANVAWHFHIKNNELCLNFLIILKSHPGLFSMSINLRHEIKATAVKCVFFFSFCPQLQHCLPVYLLLPRAHSQSSGGAQLHEPPPATHHKLSGAAPAGSPGALVPRTEGSPEEPLRQGTALFRLLLGFLSLGYKRTG